METSKSNRNFNYKKGRKLSEAALINGFKNSPVWKLLFFKPREAAWILLNQYIETNAAILSYCYTSVFRCLPGQLVCGVAITVMSCSFALAYNSTHLITPALAPLATPVVPFIPFFTSPDELYDMAFVRVYSLPLALYCCLMGVSSLVNIIICWSGYSKNPTQRGVSYSYLLIDFLFSKYLNVGQFFIQFVETLFAILIGAYLVYTGIDTYFGWFLVIISGNECFTLMSEKSRKMFTKAFVEA